jgi:hypothetical protein
MAMKINHMEGRKIGDYRRGEEIDSSVYHDNSKKGRMPFYKSIPLALGTAAMTLMPAYVLAADKAPAKQVRTAQKPANAAENAHASIPQKQQKLRILVKDFEVSGEGQTEETKYFEGDTVTSYSGNEGKALAAAIINKLKENERTGLFNKKGLYSIVDDTPLPDSKDAIKGTFYRAGGKIYFFARLVDTKTNETKHVYNVELDNTPHSIPDAGFFIATDMTIYLQ